ncbi:MAG: zinc-ribbon domain-containing protein [Clostridia bacterium]|nr:zinc-ribbon domain-containing protein [Clostridia bacterium]
MDISEILGALAFDALITLLVYFLVPLIILISQKQFSKKTLRKIMIFNGIGGFVLFTALYIALGSNEIANVFPAFLWSSLGYSILKKTSCSDVDDKDILKDDPNHITECLSCGYRDKNFFNSCPKCGKSAKRYIYLKEDTIIDTNQVKFCRKCGEKLIDNSQVCQKCGTEIVKEWRNDL